MNKTTFAIVILFLASCARYELITPKSVPFDPGQAVSDITLPHKIKLYDQDITILRFDIIARVALINNTETPAKAAVKCFFRDGYKVLGEREVESVKIQPRTSKVLKVYYYVSAKSVANINTKCKVWWSIRRY